jgi:hypothetical protein
VDVSLGPGSLNISFTCHSVVVEESIELSYSCAIGRWLSQVADSFDLFIEGFDTVLSNPVPKIFKLSSCKEALACTDFETTLIEAAQHFVEASQLLTEISC